MLADRSRGRSGHHDGRRGARHGHFPVDAVLADDALPELVHVGAA